MEESLAMAGRAVADGIGTVVATPHLFRGDRTDAQPAALESKLEELRKALRQTRIALEILLGSEVHISHRLIPEVKSNKARLVINSGAYMFIEFPADHIFPGVKSLLFELMSQGIRPIIAHPERNSVFRKNPRLLHDLIQMGAAAQANSGSLFGRYGTSVLEAVERFLELNLIQFIASDGHNRRAYSPGLSEALRRAGSIIGEKNGRALVRENPRAVLKDEELPYFPAPKSPKQKILRLSLPRALGRRA